MGDRNLTIVGNLALLFSVLISLITALSAVGEKIDLAGILFLLWIIFPYVLLSLVDILLKRITSISKLSLIFCVTSLLMFGFTLLAYVATLGDESSTYGLIFLFVPFYLHIGGVVVFGVGLLLALLAKSFKSQKL